MNGKVGVVSETGMSNTCVFGMYTRTGNGLTQGMALSKVLGTLGCTQGYLLWKAAPRAALTVDPC